PRLGSEEALGPQMGQSADERFDLAHIELVIGRRLYGPVLVILALQVKREGTADDVLPTHQLGSLELGQVKAEHDGVLQISLQGIDRTFAYHKYQVAVALLGIDAGLIIGVLAE